MFSTSRYIKISLIVLTALIIYIVFFFVAKRKQLKKEIIYFSKDQAKYLVDILSSNIKSTMLNSCEKDVQQIVEHTSNVLDVTVLRIFDQTGIIKYSANLNEIGKNLDELYEQEEPFKDDDIEYGSFCIIEDIMNEKECNECHDANEPVIASITLCISMETAERYIHNTQKSCLYITIFSVIIAIITLIILLSLLRKEHNIK